MITVPNGNQAGLQHVYITETADLDKLAKQLPMEGCEAENITTGETWILRSDGHFQKYGTAEVYPPIEETEA